MQFSTFPELGSSIINKGRDGCKAESSSKKRQINPKIIAKGSEIRCKWQFHNHLPAARGDSNLQGKVDDLLPLVGSVPKVGKYPQEKDNKRKIPQSIVAWTPHLHCTPASI